VRTLIALTEGSGVAESLPFPMSVPRDLIRRKLGDVLKGPVLPTDETTGTNQARNILSDLNLASRLQHWLRDKGARVRPFQLASNHAG
jgi:hypothetical protein